MESITLLKKMVEINSTYPSEAELSDFLFDYLSKNGFKVERQDAGNKRFNLLAEKGTGRKSLLFLCHMDTVPRSSTWTRDPMALKEEGDRLYGLGTFDMKGGIAALLKAAEASKACNAKILICVDEENISKGAWVAVQKKRKWFSGIKLVISAEPPIYSAGSQKQDINLVSVGRGGRIVMRIDIKGRPAHQARISEGINAIDEAAKMVGRMHEMKLSSHRKLGKEQVFARKISGESAGLSVPENASLELDMRLVPPSNAIGAIKRVNMFINELKRKGKLSGGAKFKVSIKERETPYLQPFQTDMGNSSVKKAMRIIRKEVGTPIINYGRSVSDENVLANELGLPVIRIGPKGGNAHSGDEWISRKGLARLTALFKALMDEF